jgi:hypothetical protein
MSALLRSHSEPCVRCQPHTAQGMDNIHPSNVKTIRGNWNASDEMADNFDSYKKVRATNSADDAARSTFTGKMESQYGFMNVQVTETDGKVVVVFTR